MITDIRTHFRNCFGLAYPNKYVEHYDGFNYLNIPKSKLSKSFHLIVPSIKSTPNNDTSIFHSANVELRLFYKSARDNRDDLDMMMDEANQIALYAVSPIVTLNNIKRVVLDSMDSEFLTSNDSAIQITLRFSVGLIFKVN
jgi:hypothetical protein